jgi:alpha-L-fucosidase 2
MFPMGGPWLCRHLWEYYEYTADMQFLKEKAYPLIKGSAEFIMSFLCEDKNGRLVSAPSYSPENSFLFKDGKPIALTYSPTMDVEICYDMLDKCIAAAETVGEDRQFISKLKETKGKLPELKVTSRGTLCEWVDDYEEIEKGHRHVSHLYGLHPGDVITRKTPELYKAAQKSIEQRLSSGGAGTGWSRAWTISFFARFHEGDKAYEHVTALLQKSTAVNFFDMHPPFQIDGNFGFTAGIAEMLLQSHDGEPGKRIISILPALPAAWKNGSIEGIMARGGVSVDISWKDGKAEKIGLTPLKTNIIRLECKNIDSYKLFDIDGKRIGFKISDGIAEFIAEKSKTYIFIK